MTSPTLELQQVSVYYGNQAAIEQASLTVQAGELMALVGPSGCGKSSLLASINRMTDSLLGRVSGTIMLGGERLPARMPRPCAAGLAWCSSSPTLSALHYRQPAFSPGGARCRAVSATPCRTNCWRWLWRKSKTGCRSRRWDCPAGNSNGCALPGRWCWNRGCCCWTSPCSALDGVLESVGRTDCVAQGRYTLLMVTTTAQARRIADGVTVC